MQNKRGSMEQKMQTWKNITKHLFFGGILLVSFSSCSGDNTTKSGNAEKDNLEHKGEVQLPSNTENVKWVNQKTVEGNALGTTFVIKTSDDSLRLEAQEIEDLFAVFNAELSTYIPSSKISVFNTENDAIDLNKTEYFKACFELSEKIYKQTNGAFDPTVYPLVSLWGFFKDIDIAPTQNEIDSVMQFVGLNEDMYSYANGILEKKDKRFKLVFNAIAKGQSVDILADFLDHKGQSNYFIEVGGEIKVKGINDYGKKWTIGIDVPVESNTGTYGVGQRDLENYIEVKNKAVATSGNYRDFYELDGKKYSHTISPKTGKPVKHSLLSATVIAEDAATADAFATAFMVLGVEKSLALLKTLPDENIDAYLLFENEQGRIERAFNRGMNQYLMD